MAVVNYLKVMHQNRSSMNGVIEYVCQDHKIGLEPGLFEIDHTEAYNRDLNHPENENRIRLITGINCCAETAYPEFMATKKRFRKDTGMFFYHYTQSFKDGENISPKEAHEIALKFAKDNFKDFEVLVATHVDNEHLHSHFIINSVGFETGMKLHSGPDTLRKLRAYSDEICKEHGLSVLPPYEKGTTNTIGQREYHSAMEGRSWKFTLIKAIEDALLLSDTREHFIANMEYEGYKVNWSKDRKYITYATPEGKRCRDISLHDDTYLKENLEKLFAWRSSHNFVPGAPEPRQGWLVQINPPPKKEKNVLDEAVSLGKNLENVPDAPPPVRPVSQVDSRLRQRELIKKLAQGHRLPSEGQDESQGWDQSM
jgi:hypothetical protein